MSVGFHYGQDDAGARVYVLERYDKESKAVVVQSVPRGKVEYGFVPAYFAGTHGLVVGSGDCGRIVCVLAQTHRPMVELTVSV